MRPLLTLVLSGALASPGAAWRRRPRSPTFPRLRLPPPSPQAAAPEAIEAPLDVAHPLAKAEINPALSSSTPTTVAPVIVEGEDKSDDGKVGRKVGTVAGGVAGGVAGAAVAGPIGKFAGAFVGKRLARALLGDGKDKAKTPTIRPAQVMPSADQAAAAPRTEALAEADRPKP
jgi:hypothetical protein